MSTAEQQAIVAAVLGSPDFTRRFVLTLSRRGGISRAVSGTVADGAALLASNRPNLVFVEIGLGHTPELHARLRALLKQLRERSQQSVFVAAALVAPERLYFGGDLLFAAGDSLDPSEFVDTFLAVAPGAVPSIPTIEAQIESTVELWAGELRRRALGGKPLPALGAHGWVQSLADPRSRELWMRWLPRYASYTNENPIVIGETGTGKTNLALALHSLSLRSGEFVSITPRDFSSSELVQAELFGSVAGAYTGAVDKWGLVKRAERGTLFIDELQSIDKELQGKLITFIENKIYRRVGTAESTSADVRFVFASNKSLYAMMGEDILRHDFAYRLERMQLELAPLRQRRLDIAAALAYALAKVARQRPYGRPIVGLNSGAYRLLFGQNWLGNLRQLENCVARLCEYSDIHGAPLIEERHATLALESTLAAGSGISPAEVIAEGASRLVREALAGSISSVDGGLTRFSDTVRTVALEVSGGDPDSAASLIGDHPNLLRLYAARTGAD